MPESCKDGPWQIWTQREREARRHIVVILLCTSMYLPMVDLSYMPQGGGSGRGAGRDCADWNWRLYFHGHLVLRFIFSHRRYHLQLLFSTSSFRPHSSSLQDMNIRASCGERPRPLMSKICKSDDNGISRAVVILFPSINGRLLIRLRMPTITNGVSRRVSLLLV